MTDISIFALSALWNGQCYVDDAGTPMDLDRAWDEVDVTRKSWWSEEIPMRNNKRRNHRNHYDLGVHE